MDDMFKIILPVLLTGLGVIVFSLYADIGEISQRQAASDQCIYRLEQVEMKVKELRDNESRRE